VLDVVVGAGVLVELVEIGPVAVDVLVVGVVVVVVVVGFLSDGTHSSRRWISVPWSGPNWLSSETTVVPNFVADFAL
jgi:hypothetical protein